MAGSVALDDTSALFAEVTSAVERYRDAKPDRESRTLARRMANEKIIHSQLIHKFRLLAHTSIKNHDDLVCMEQKLGSEGTADALQIELQEMADMLRNLKADLTKASLGTEVLAKLKRQPTVFRLDSLQTPLDKALENISKLNQTLASHMQKGQISLPVRLPAKGVIDLRLFLQKDSNDRTSFFHVSTERYDCACLNPQGAIQSDNDQQSSSAGIDTPSSSEMLDCGVSPLVLLRCGHLSVTAFTMQSSTSHTDAQVFQSNSELGFALEGGNLVNSSNPFRMRIRRGQPSDSARSLTDFLRLHDVSRDSGLRFEIAFHLSIAVLLLWTGPQLAGGKTCTDWTVMFDLDDGDNMPSLWLHSKTDDNERDSRFIVGDNLLQILARETLLARLGMYLIALAYGLPLREISQSDQKLAAMNNLGINSDAADLLIAKNMLAQGRIADEISPDFESIVSMCINQEYREAKGGAVNQLHIGEPSFLEVVSDTIVGPLYGQMRRNLGCACGWPQAEVDERAHSALELNITAEDGGGEANNPAKSFQDNRAAERDENEDFLAQMSERRAAGLSLSGGLIDKPSSLSGNGTSDHRHDNFQQWTASSGNPLDRFTQFQAQDGNEVLPSHPANMMAQPNRDFTGIPSSWFAKNTDFGISGAQIFSHPEDELDASELSIDATTDTAFILLSERSEDLPTMTPGHPLLKIKDITLRVLLREFQAWRRHGTGSSEAGMSSNVPAPSRKRGRQSSGKGSRSYDQEGSDEEMPQQGASTAHRRKRRHNEGVKSFACPYFKKDPVSHRYCCQYTLSRIRDVKQHLMRCHRLPIYCPRCLDEFNDEDGRDNHIRDGDCPKKTHAKPEGTTEAQRNKLNKKPPSGQSVEQQWYGIFDILFPDCIKRPNSPWLDPTLVHNVVDYHRYLTTEGPAVLTNIFQASRITLQNLPNGESDARALLFSMFEEGIQELYRQWMDQVDPIPSMSETSVASVTETDPTMSSPGTYSELPLAPAAGFPARSDQHQPAAPPSDIAHFPMDFNIWENGQWLANLSLNAPNNRPVATQLMPQEIAELGRIYPNPMPYGEPTYETRPEREEGFYPGAQRNME